MSTTTSTHTPPQDQTIQPYIRVFALELQQTDLIIRTKGNRLTELITPSGARISRLFSCGALTEINRNTRGGGFIRIADPTGVLILHLKTKNPEMYETLDALTTPAFVSVTATIESDTGQGDSGYRLILETIHPSDRAGRDGWILQTAQRTLERLIRLSAIINGEIGNEDENKAITRYKTSTRQLKFLAGVIEKAVNQVQEKTETGPVSQSQQESAPDETADKIMQLIRQHSGPRGVSVQELTMFAQKAGFSETVLLDTIRTLIADDEIYQPSSGFVKIL